MPAYTVPKTPLATGPGYWFHGDLGSALPANTVVGSVFTDDWSAVSGWHLGTVTRDGTVFNYGVETETIYAAEYFDGLQVVTTSRTVQFRLEPMLPTATWLKRFLNGGTLSTAGSGTTLLSTYTPPVPGSEVRCMLGWESQDNTERLVIEQAFQTGSIEVSRRKAGGDTNASFPLEFTAEVPASNFIFRHYFAGTARG
jgi:hypothetical protein